MATDVMERMNNAAQDVKENRDVIESFRTSVDRLVEKMEPGRDETNGILKRIEGKWALKNSVHVFTEELNCCCWPKSRIVLVESLVPLVLYCTQ